MNNLPRVIQLVTAALRAWQSGSRVHMCHHGAPLSLDGFFHRNYLHICWMELMLEGLSVISPWENGCLLSLWCSLSSCNTQVFSRGPPTCTLSPHPLPLCVSLLLSYSAEELICWEALPPQPTVHSAIAWRLPFPH